MDFLHRWGALGSPYGHISMKNMKKKKLGTTFALQGVQL
jgi:hypothetical protein